MKSFVLGGMVTVLLLGATTSASAQLAYRGPTAVFRDSQAAVPLFELKPTLGPFARGTTAAKPTALTVRLNGIAGDQLSPTRCPMRIILPDSTRQDAMPISRPNLTTVERMPVGRSSCSIR
ncbi:MAG: hypothetical protein IPO52_10430 [Gemmatimonadetes bacterium]|nr:hypothetical protein [Gemmatimonadota bacterium]